MLASRSRSRFARLTPILLLGLLHACSLALDFDGYRFDAGDSEMQGGAPGAVSPAGGEGGVPPNGGEGGGLVHGGGGQGGAGQGDPCAEVSCEAGQACSSGACVADRVVSLSAVNNRTCAVWLSGRASCWGSDDLMGDGKSTDSPVPSEVLIADDTPQLSDNPKLTDAFQLVAGRDFSCALRSLDGRVYCWGINSAGQLGQSTLTEGERVPLYDDLALATPVTVVGSALEGQVVEQLSASSEAVCARLSSDDQSDADNTVACWGKRLQNGQTADSPIAQWVVDAAGQRLLGVIELASGGGYTCALHAPERSLYCWGSGSSNASNAATGLGAVPTQARWRDANGVLGDPVTGITHFAPGSHNVCVAVPPKDVGGDPATYCWGTGVTTTPQGISVDQPVLARLEGGGNAPLTNVTGIWNFQDTCFNIAGQLWCNGDDSFGLLGNDDVVDCSEQKSKLRAKSALALPVYGIGDVLSVGMNSQHACALKGSPNQGSPNQGLYCWGRNLHALFPTDATSLCSPILLDNPSLQSANEVAVGWAHVCVRRSGGGSTLCWGWRADGRLGDGFLGGVETRPKDLSLVDAHQQPLALPLVELALGSEHKCGRTRSGEVYCWGDGADGQLGPLADGQSASYSPIQVPGLVGNVTQLAASATSTCALLGDELSCWGTEYDGTLADPTAPPVRLAGNVKVADIELNVEGRACAIGADQRVYCWGPETDGELGLGASADAADGSGGAGGAASEAHAPTLDQASPVLLSDGTELLAKSLANGDDFRCAVATDGGVYCWGRNEGRLGNSPETADSDVPLPVPNDLPVETRRECGFTSQGVAASPLVDAQLVASGRGSTAGFSCAVVGTAGCVVCFGLGGDGRLGNTSAYNPKSTDGSRSISPRRLVPVERKEGGLLKGVKALALGATHGCALLQGGEVESEVVCWGRNDAGQLGQGMTSPAGDPELAVQVFPPVKE
jgi:alpha-tubulin suppressor-like RCC1 family protein